ncbi:MAG: TIGR02281 family clan AA aspartic protease [Marinagarivorans sp.]
MQPPHVKIARWLSNGAWLALLALLTLYFAAKERAQINPNQEVNSTQAGGYAQVQLKANNHHHYLANGTINHKPVTFMVDTGASDVAIPKDLAEELGLVAGEAGISTTANGDVRVYRTVIERLQLGDIVLHNVKGSLNPGMDANNEILLGMSFLKQLDFSQTNDVLTLRTKTN